MELGDGDLHVEAESESGDDVGLTLEAGEGAGRGDQVISIAHVLDGIEGPVPSGGGESGPRRQ